MTSYLVTIEIDHHFWTSLKMRARDEQTPTKNISSWRFTLYEKNQKNLREGWMALPPPPHSLYVQGLSLFL